MSNLFPVIDKASMWLEQEAQNRVPQVGAWLLSVYRNWLKSNTQLSEGKAVLKALGKYLEIPTVTRLMVSNIDAPDKGVVAFTSLPPNAVKALTNGAALVSVSMHHAVQSVMHMLDFLTQYAEKNPGKDLTRISVEQCAAMTQEWDRELERIKEVEAMNAGTALLYTETDPDSAGWTVRVLSSFEAICREGERLGNCLKTNTHHYASGASTIIVVRDAEDRSMAAIEARLKAVAVDGKVSIVYQIHQFYGPHNRKLPPGHRAYSVFHKAMAGQGWSWNVEGVKEFDHEGDEGFDEDEAVEAEGEVELDDDEKYLIQEWDDAELPQERN